MKKFRLFTILFISLMIVVSAAQADTLSISKSYTGSEQAPAVGSAYAEYYCSATSGTQLVSDSSKCRNIKMTDAAQALYYYSESYYADSEGYKADFTETNTLSLEITPLTLTVSPDAGQSKAEGQSDPVLTYNYSGTVNGEAAAFTGALTRAEGDEIGSYEITQGDLALTDADPFKSENYTLAFTEGVQFEITDNANKPTVISGLIYSGSAQPLVNAGSGSGVWHYIVNDGEESTDIPQGTDAADYTINCWFIADSGNEGDNFWSETNPLVLTTSIAKAAIAATEITAPVALDNLTYDGSDLELLSAGSSTAGTMLYKLDTDEDYADAVPTAVNAGTYTVSYYVQGDANHEDSTPETLSAVIAPKALENTMVTFDRIHYVQDGNTHTVDVSLNDDDCGELVEDTDWSLDTDNSVISASESGIYTVQVQGLGNYTGTASAEWVIDTTRIAAQSYKIAAGKEMTFALVTDLQNPTITWSISDETIAEFVDDSDANGAASAAQDSFEAENEAEAEDDEENEADAAGAANDASADDDVFFVEDGTTVEDLIILASKDGEDAEAADEGVLFFVQNASVQGSTVTLKGLRAGTILLSADINGIYTVTQTVTFTANTAPNEVTFYILDQPYHR